MKSITSRTVGLISVCLLSLSLTGCGGSGGGGSADNDDGQGANSASSVKITSDNAAEIVAAALGTKNVETDYVDTSSLGVVTSRPASRLSLRQFTEQKVHRIASALAAGSPAAGSGVVGAFIQNTALCDSGNVAISVNDADNDTVPSTGDTLTITENNCRINGEDGAYIITSGTYSLSGLVLEGDPSIAGTSWQFGFSAGFSDDYTIRIHDGNDDLTVGLDGGMAVDSGSDDNGVSETYKLTIASFSVDARLNDASSASSIKDYADEYSVNNSTGEVSEELNGIFTDSDFGGNGRVQIETLDTFTGVLGDQHFSTGKLKVTGADDSSVTLTIVDAANVTLEVDEDGDGATDDTIAMTWTDLS
jgi:hypothetical protein